jgi:hypothetical protein
VGRTRGPWPFWLKAALVFSVFNHSYLCFTSKARLGMSAATLFVAPAPEVVAELNLATSLKAIYEWSGLGADSIVTVNTHLAMPTDESFDSMHPRMFAAVPEVFVQDAMKNFKGTFIEIASVFLAHRVAIHVCTVSQVSSDKNKGKAKDQEQSEGAPKKLQAARKVKLSNLIDTLDEMEVYAAAPSQIDHWYANYTRIKRGAPLEEVEPTPDQINALHIRIVDLGAEPYADFSILTPHGRRTAKRLRHRSWMPQEDGSYIAEEVPGPASLDAWEACWGVYEVCLLMLRFPSDDGSVNQGDEIVSPIALETYLQHFRRLAKEHPEVWHLCQRAEDRCRAEHFPRIRRRLSAEKDHSQVITWSEVFTAAALDDRYWDKEVRRPALNFLARGSRGQKRSQESDDEGTKQKVGRARGRGQAKKRQQQEQNKDRPQQEQSRNKDKGRSKGGSHPQKRGKDGLFVTTPAGKQICFNYAGGRTCANKPCEREHVCQKCFGCHQTDGQGCTGFKQ